MKNESEYGSLFDPESNTKEGFVIVAIDDFKISSKTYDQHKRQFTIFLDKAVLIGNEFKLVKCVFRFYQDSNKISVHSQTKRFGQRTEGSTTIAESNSTRTEAACF